MKRILVFTVLAAFGATGVVGCGEREQSVVYKDGKYLGKRDKRPWDNEPPTYGSARWVKGDSTGWGEQVKSRNESQDEYKRIDH